MAKELSLDDFLNDKGSRGARTQYLTKWRDKGFAHVVMHLSSPITKVWRHNFQRVVERKDKDNPNHVFHEIWSDKFVCFEDDETLEKQHWRDKTTRARDLPPSRCPTCKMIEHIYQLVVSGKVDWRQPIFEFRAPGKPNVVLHAGGITGLFNAKGVTDEQKRQLRDSGIVVKDVWKWTMIPKLEYVFRVVDVDDPKDVQVAVEPNGLGDAVKSVISKSIESLGPERGNPLRNPFVIKWKYDKNASNFSDIYDANPIMTMPITPRVSELIRGPMPSIVGVTKRIKVAAMRTMLEGAAVVKLPWDAYFKGAVDEADEAEEHADADDAAGDDSFNYGANASGARPAAAQVPADLVGRPAPQSIERIPCDAVVNGVMCGYPMLPTDTTCAKCGAVYEIDAGEPAAPAAQQAGGWNLSGKGSSRDDALGPGSGFVDRSGGPLY